VQYTTNENKLIVNTGIEAVGSVSALVVDDMQTDYRDEGNQLIRSEITALHRLPKMEADRVIASWYPDPKEAAEVAKEVAATKKKAAAAQAKLDEEAAEKTAADAPQIPSAKATVKVIDEFAGRYAIADLDEYQNANTKAEKLAVIEANYLPAEDE